MAFNVPSNKLKEYRKRIKATGVFVSPMLYHSDAHETGFVAKKDETVTWESFYFCDPDGAYMELTAQHNGFSPEDIQHKPKTAKDLET